MQPGTSLGPYRIDRELGSGGMGRVYAATAGEAARVVAPGVTVALKVVHSHLLETPGFFKRFMREGEIGKTVRHPNVVRTFDCDQVVVDGVATAFLVMECVEGQTLRELLEELPRVPEELCRHIGREVCKGLAAVHAAGVIHRDMKPDNVLITEDHVVKVMDLGVARLQDEALRLSQTGAFVGSIHYAAPECFREGGKNVDGRADLHALGLVLYELACGVNPYLADDVPQILAKVLHEKPRRLGDINPQLSPFFEEVVHCLLAKSPDERFATAGDLLGVLAAGEESEWWRTRARGIQAETRRPLRRIRIPRETAVYGRETELATLRRLYENACNGDGQVVLIDGEAGIGKSRLVDELVSRLQGDGADLNFVFGSYPPGGAATASGAFSSAFHEQFGERGATPYLHQTPLLVPAFDALLKGDAPPPGAQPLTRDSIATCFLNATRGLAAERATVVLIDDLHFAPDEARALFTSLAMGVPGQRVLLIGTTRPGISEDWRSGLTRLAQTTTLTIGRLGPKDLIELLQDSFQSETLASSLAAQIALKSDGNPFFAFEIIRGLREGQFITQKADGTWVSTRVIDDIQIPSSVLDLVHARVADLTEDERDLLDVASCWGYQFDPALVGEVVGLSRIPALKRFGQIERQHRLVRSVGRNYVFDHHQIQEALYGGLNEQLREEYHAALADALATRINAADTDPETLDGALCVDLCEHYFKGARGQQGLRYLEPALQHLEAGYLHGSAVALADRALCAEELVTGDERVALLLRQATWLARLGRQGLRGEALEEARAIQCSSSRRGRVELALAGYLNDVSRYDEALALALHVQAEAERAGDTELLAAALSDRSWALFRAGHIEEARPHYERAIELFASVGDEHGVARATGGLGNALWLLGRLEEAKAHYDRCVELARTRGDLNGEAVASLNRSIIPAVLGQFREARSYCERSLEIARKIGHRVAEGAATGNLGSILLALGRIEEARACAQRSVEIARETADPQKEALALLNAGNQLSLAGERREARERLVTAVALAREVGAQRELEAALCYLGNHELRCGEVDTARESLGEATQIAREIGDTEGVAEGALGLGVVASRLGETEVAREHLAEALTSALDAGLHGPEVLARVYLAALPGGDVDAARAALEAHANEITMLISMEARFRLFQTSGDAAQLVVAHGQLMFLRDHVGAAYQTSILENVPLHSEIVAACKELGWDVG